MFYVFQSTDESSVLFLGPSPVLMMVSWTEQRDGVTFTFERGCASEHRLPATRISGNKATRKPLQK